jgi:hypothetical protein
MPNVPNCTRIILLIFICVLLAACTGFAQQATPTLTIEPATPTNTITINWFPATVTPTPQPSQAATPTPQILPDRGILLFSDNFSQADQWIPNLVNSGNSIINSNKLTLTIPAGTKGGTTTSLRSAPNLTDFFMEITVDLNLCRGSDQYNLLFRVSSLGDFYRFTATCNGQTRFERVISGKPFVIRDWTPSADLPLGAPGKVKISIWAAGRDLRIFLNDHFQFNIDDQFLSQGGLGVSIRTEADNPETVSFSDLAVFSASMGSVTSFPLALPSP